MYPSVCPYTSPVLCALGFLLHVVLVMSLLSCFPTWRAALLFYGLANVGVGVLSIQLQISHLAEPFDEKGDIWRGWARHQARRCPAHSRPRPLPPGLLPVFPRHP